MEMLDEKVNAHLPYYSTLKSSGMFSSKRLKLDCSSSVVVTQNQLRSQIYTGWSCWGLTLKVNTGRIYFSTPPFEGALFKRLSYSGGGVTQKGSYSGGGVIQEGELFRRESYSGGGVTQEGELLRSGSVTQEWRLKFSISSFHFWQNKVQIKPLQN